MKKQEEQGAPCSPGVVALFGTKLPNIHSFSYASVRQALLTKIAALPTLLRETGLRLAAHARRSVRLAGLEQEPRLSPKARFFVWRCLVTSQERKSDSIVALPCKALTRMRVWMTIDTFPASDPPYFVGAGAPPEKPLGGANSLANGVRPMPRPLSMASETK